MRNKCNDSRCIANKKKKEKTMKTWITTGVLATVVIAGAGYVLNHSLGLSNSDLHGKHSTAEIPIASDMSNAGMMAEGSAGAYAESQSTHGDHEDRFVAELIQKLRASYESQIHLLHIQASLIKVKEFVLERYPTDGESVFASVIRTVFPEFADAILELLERLDAYHVWLMDNQPELLALDAPMQQGMIWEKRREMFGSDAEKIWAQEMAEMSRQQTSMHQLIDRLDKAHDISMDEKLYQLQEAVNEHFTGSIQDIAVSGGVISKAFFNLNSVQDELKALDSEARQEKINDVRRQLGLTETQIERLAKQDAVKNKRWENGLAYMAEREVLLASVSEYEREDELTALRERYFKHEALTIQREEESDFWRYNRRRVYGNN